MGSDRTRRQTKDQHKQIGDFYSNARGESFSYSNSYCSLLLKLAAQGGKWVKYQALFAYGRDLILNSTQ